MGIEQAYADFHFSIVEALIRTIWICIELSTFPSTSGVTIRFEELTEISHNGFQRYNIQRQPLFHNNNRGGGGDVVFDSLGLGRAVSL